MADPMTARAPTVRSVQVGRVAPLGPDGVPSGFVKRPVGGAVAVGPLGLDGDEQADLTVHGGPEKAVYGYAAAHYAAWAAEHPRHAATLTPGAFGENLTIDGLTEADIAVGEIHAIGTARLQVCQPRQPCFKFALRFGDARMPKAMVRNGRAGWYYRVLEPGAVAPGDAVRVIHRPEPAFPFTRLIEIINLRGGTGAELDRLAEIDGVASWIRETARRSS